MKEITTLQKHIGAYQKTKDIYTEYIRGGKDETFYSKNRNAIDSCISAKTHFESLQRHKLPTVAQLRNEYASLQTRKNKAYATKNSAWKTRQELLKAQKNLHIILDEQDIKSDEQSKFVSEQNFPNKKRKRGSDSR